MSNKFKMMEVDGAWLTRQIRFEGENAVKYAQHVLPDITVEQVEAIVAGTAELTGTSPNMEYVRLAPGVDLKRLMAFSCTLQDAEKAYNAQARTVISMAGDMESEEFWSLVDQLVEEIGSAYKRKKTMSEAVKYGCDEMIRSYLFGRNRQEVEMTEAWLTMAKFVNTYENVVNELSRRLADFDDISGGDRYGDLMDSLPLAGKDVYDGLGNGTLANMKNLQDAVAYNRSKVLYEGIVFGENYVVMNLMDQLKKKFHSISGWDPQD